MTTSQTGSEPQLAPIPAAMQDLRDQETLLFATDNIKQLAQQDMNLFSALAMPDVATLDFPDFYIWLWSQLSELVLSEDKAFPKYAIGLPRGHGKTMVVKLLLAFAILFSTRRYILVICANTRKAEAIIADVCDILDSFNIQEVFGNWRYDLEIDRQDLKKFTFNGRPVILEAAGYGTAIRGSNQKNERPDLMLFDDTQTRECASSINEAKAYQQWFLGTAMKAKSPNRCLYLYIGNMYKDLEIIPGQQVYGCMLRNLQLSPHWTSIIVGALLEDGSALWEQLHSRDTLMEEFELDLSMGQAEIFFAEVLNDPKTTTSFYIDTGKIQQKLPVPDESHEGGFIVIDPATNKNTPDQVVIGYFEIYDTVPVCMDLVVGKFTGPEIVQEALKLAMAKGASVIFVESNAYQYSLCDWFNYFINQIGLHGLIVQDIYNKSKTKNARILELFKSLMSGGIKTTKKTNSVVVAQAAVFDPTKTNNIDDILDTLEMATQCVLKHRGLIPIPGDLSLETRLNVRGVQDQLSAPSQAAF
jgi:hypothetical protein